MGIEPTRAGATIRCVNHFATIAIMAGIVGIEPTPTVLETVVLPLNYIPIIKNGREWIRTTEPEGADLQSAAFSQTSLPFHNGGAGRNRTADTRSFNPLLYRLSYRAKNYILFSITVLAGFEPAISCVTGRRDRPLHHRTNIAGAGFEPTTFGL